MLIHIKYTTKIKGFVIVLTYSCRAAEVMDTVLLPSSEDGGRPKKKKKEWPKEGKNDEAESKHSNVEEDKTQKIESNTDYRLHDFPLRDEANDQ